MSDDTEIGGGYKNPGGHSRFGNDAGNGNNRQWNETQQSRNTVDDSGYQRSMQRENRSGLATPPLMREFRSRAQQALGSIFINQDSVSCFVFAS